MKAKSLDPELLYRRCERMIQNESPKHQESIRKYLELAKPHIGELNYCFLIYKFEKGGTKE